MAKKEIVLVLSMLLLIASSEGENEYDYSQVVMQWQPATCSSSTLPTECVQTPEDRYSIHGVWPSLLSGNIPECSGSPAYNEALISTIKGKMDQDWPNVIFERNRPFWSHEWKKHGTCSQDYLGQFDYFNFGLYVYANYNLLSILNGNGIYPNGQQYTKTAVETAIFNAIGKWPALRCNTNYWTGNVQLHEISLCFTKDGPTLEDCPYNAVTCYGESFLWNSWSNSVAMSKE